jgi:uronate dehydrogenase
MKKIAITGAAGGVGTGLRKELRDRGYALRLLDVRPIENLAPHEDSAVVDIEDQVALATHLRGCDAVLHLAACTSDADWPQQMRLSIQGTINLFEAARAAGVERVVYASSNHVVGLHPRAHGTRTEVILRPDSRYGVGKAFGELVASLHAYKYGMRVLTIRIGNANAQPIDRRRLGNWISWRDLAQLIAIGVEHPDLVHEIVWGISDATGRNYDNTPAYALGYQPLDQVAPFEADILMRDPPPAPGSDTALQPLEAALGGDFAQTGFIGSIARLAH